MTVVRRVIYSLSLVFAVGGTPALAMPDGHHPGIQSLCAHRNDAFCQAREHRRAIRLLKHLAARRADVVEVDLKVNPDRVAIWNLRKLKRANHYWRRTLKKLNRMDKPIHYPANHWAWLCIHSHEGDWEDGGDPYWGGLQMDREFMHSYGADMIAKYGEPRGYSGPNGWENPWTPVEQEMVAERAKDSGRGFWPWPNTAHYCGLI